MGNMAIQSLPTQSAWNSLTQKCETGVFRPFAHITRGWVWTMARAVVELQSNSGSMAGSPGYRKWSVSLFCACVFQGEVREHGTALPHPMNALVFKLVKCHRGPLRRRRRLLSYMDGGLDGGARPRDPTSAAFLTKSVNFFLRNGKMSWASLRIPLLRLIGSSHKGYRESLMYPPFRIQTAWWSKASCYATPSWGIRKDIISSNNYFTFSKLCASV